VYYGILLFALAGPGALLEVSVAESRRSVSVYAVRVAEDQLRIVVLNKQRLGALQVSIDCRRLLRAAHLIVMTGPGLDATHGITLQGGAIGRDGVFAPGSAPPLPTSGTWTTCYVNALSCALIEVSLAA
jgi:hypothetical protein